MKQLMIFCNLHKASTRIEPTAAAASTLRYHTYSRMLLGHNGKRQIAIVATTVNRETAKHYLRPANSHGFTLTLVVCTPPTRSLHPPPPQPAYNDLSPFLGPIAGIC